MQNQTWIFNNKEYTNKGGLTSAQKTWYQKAGYAYLVESIFRLRSDERTAIKALSEKAGTVFQPKALEVIRADARELMLARMECDLIVAVQGDWTSDPKQGEKLGRRHFAAILRESNCPLSDEEKAAFFEYSKKLGYSETIRRETARKVEMAKASPARRNNTPKRERKNRGQKDRQKVKGRKQRK